MNNDEYLTIKNVVVTVLRTVAKKCANSTIVMYHAPILAIIAISSLTLANKIRSIDSVQTKSINPHFK